MKIKQLKRWPLIIAFVLLTGVSVATTTVLAESNSLTVRASVLNVRLGPGLSYGLMGQVQRGTKLTIIKQENSWDQVRLAGNKIGWVASWLVDQDEATTTSARTATVKTGANIRQYASTSAKVLGTAAAGDTLDVIYQEGSWTQIAYKNTAAWVSTSTVDLTGKTVTLASPEQTQPQSKQPAQTVSAIKVTTNLAVNLRSAAGLNAPVMTQLPKNTTLTVLDQSSEWYKVQTASGKTGYLASWTVTTPGTKSAKAATNLAEATIVLDPGHGGSDSGAESTSGRFEKTYTLQTAEAIGAALKAQGANVIYTRSSDKFVDLAPRPVVGEKAHADAFISVHFDSSANANEASGFTTYYYNAKKDMQLAKSLNSAFDSNLKMTNRGVQFGNFEVIRNNTQPAVLLEMGYINNDKDFAHIASGAYQQQVAGDVVKGLTAYFKAGNHQ
ncbi:N-acetylmuramoyl-L-alanine amidase [Lacticaseibacillus camelliae]|uniref:N-acetylmuramoyl-L-alanine amidase n=1 Tax=Lacticaseibacillus camelliae DSM 22697 = JCM 13995 TaxID=1423730 RepID=A0A0R2FBN5_9LACO|nr:N-acetylmuramoyl-L-alanine amidase [Lacticaseibacillus camelliae]KRN22205.1 N-acetylmuramoyl-L-alanine amidase [Lacticaseibacillus camelliae DSM 22697 = JCM 13995]